MKRVVVTGLGALTPYGYGYNFAWQGVIQGKSCISFIENIDVSDIPTKIAGQIKWQKDGGWFDPSEYIDNKTLNRLANFTIFGLVGVAEAVLDANLDINNFDTDQKERIGVIMGSGIGGIEKLEKNIDIMRDKGTDKISPFFLPNILINIVNGEVAMKYGITGPNFAIVNACSTGNTVIGEGMNCIKRGDADIMIVGGTEGCISKIALAGFSALRGLSTSDNPETASRPYNSTRDGFVMSEGSACLILEEYEHAKKRGAKIYAEVAGYGWSNDAYHITAPHPQGKGAVSAMKRAIENAGLNLEDIDYINSHATSTPLGDMLELKAICDLFGSKVKDVAISSTKSATGHLLGAAGALEGIFSIMAINENLIPSTINLNDPEPFCAEHNLNLVPNFAQKKAVNAVLSNSFGFGGCNSCIVFKRV